MKGFYRSDVGMFGTANMLGIFFVITYVFLLVKAQLHSVSKYLKYNYLSILMVLPLADYSYHPSYIPFLCIILYLTDCEYKEAKNNVQHRNTLL